MNRRTSRRAGLTPLLLVALAVAPAAAAAAPSAKLLPRASPTAAPGLRLGVAEGAAPPAPTPWAELGVVTGAGALTALVATPVTMVAAAFVGTQSPNLVAAALPSLLLLLAVPPAAVTFAMAGASRAWTSRAFGWSPALWVALGAQAALLTGAVLLGLNARNAGDAALYTVTSAVVLPLAAGLTMHLTTPVVRF